MSQKILISGVKPTGTVHIGNYFGAMKQFIDLESSYESYVFIADLHALTSVQNREQMTQGILDVALDYLAIGLDPKKTCLFKQSDLPEVTELAWTFNCITTMPYLMRAHAFKDAEAKNKEINVGVFDYPILMAADILIQNADVVPVGLDQKQHIEYTRDIAEKFNHIFGETFKLPEPLIMESVATVLGTDGRKMSKSYGNTIPLFAEEDELRKLVMGIVTDSSGGIPENVYVIHKLIKPESELKDLYESKKGKYKELKEALADDLEAFIAPMRERRKELAKNKDEVLAMLAENALKIKARIAPKMNEVREKIGVKLD
ncbi:MAG: tryptophan--tRNA ligase [Candidatus Paceibacterota bacterium]|jgi:tryptophanyl-tRNA synthetase